MADKLELNAIARTDVGKGASRRLRHQDIVPAIVYGIGKEPEMLALKHNEVIKALENEAFYSQVINLTIDGKSQQVVLKDLQRHVFKPKIMHMDFLRIKAGEKITMLIPLHFIGEDVAPGVKEEGGIFSHALNEVEVKCLPANLPAFIEVDLSNMALSDIVHLSDLKIPKGVELTVLAQGEEYDQPVATMHLPRVEVEEEEVVAEEGEEGEEAAAEEGAEEAEATEK